MISQKIRLSFGLLVFFTLNFTACIKEPKTDVVYGPQVKPEKIASALQKAVGPADSPALYRKEEVVYRESSRLIRGRPIVDITSSSRTTIVEKVETSHQWQIKEVEEYRIYDPSGKTEPPPPLIREAHHCWNKDTAELEACEIETRLRSKARSQRSDNSPLVLFEEIQKNSGQNPDNEMISYHNLKSKTYTAAPPESVATSPNCGGLPECLIEITEIEFDRVAWDDDQNGYLVHYLMKISPNVPKSARYLELCQQASIQVPQDGQDPRTAPRFLVTFCNTVKNFLAGKE